MPAATKTITQTAETIYLETDAMIIAEQVARGCYQASLVAGTARWSGADLIGTARGYAGHYARSRDSLVRKMRAAGLTVAFVKGINDKLIAIVSCDPVTITTEGKRSERVLHLAA